jgi:hypothetical protein
MQERLAQLESLGRILRNLTRTVAPDRLRARDRCSAARGVDVHILRWAAVVILRGVSAGSGLLVRRSIDAARASE